MKKLTSLFFVFALATSLFLSAEKTEAQVRSAGPVFETKMGDVPMIFEIELYAFLRQNYPDIKDDAEIYYQKVSAHKQRFSELKKFDAVKEENQSLSIGLERVQNGQKKGNAQLRPEGMKASPSDVITLAYNQKLIVAIIDHRSPLESDMNQTRLIEIKPSLQKVLIEEVPQPLSLDQKKSIIRNPEMESKLNQRKPELKKAVQTKS